MLIERSNFIVTSVSVKYFKGLTDGCLPAVFCSSITMSYFVAMKSEKWNWVHIVNHLLLGELLWSRCWVCSSPG